MHAIPKTAENITGRTYHRWKVLSYVGPGPDRRGSLWLCQCVCGVVRSLVAGDLRRGATRSCGCSMVEYHTRRTNGHYGRTPEGPVWYQARARCTNPGHKQYQWYGARGVTMCERWQKSFAAFLADMGSRPSPKHTLDRIDNDRGYWCGRPDCPECGPAKREPNCRWASRHEQARNKRNNRLLTFRGETRCLAEWAEHLGASLNTLDWRLRRGWPVERALSTPSRPRGPRATPQKI